MAAQGHVRCVCVHLAACTELDTECDASLQIRHGGLQLGRLCLRSDRVSQPRVTSSFDRLTDNPFSAALARPSR